MSTNAVIRVEGFKHAELYKHWDGYPTATMPWLKAFNERFTDAVDVFPEEKFAQLVRSSAMDVTEFNLDSSRHTGWGVTSRGKSHYNFLYLLKKDGTVSLRQ